MESQLTIAKSSNHKLITAYAKLEKLLTDSAYLELLDDFLSASGIDTNHWMNSDYPKNQNHPEHLTHKTVHGLYVRSKSESMIAMALSEREIPFRYENIITLNDIPIAPDFTIIHPKTGKTIYWEHFGMIDNPTYYQDFTLKIKTYCQSNIILGDNLIASFETTERPLTYATIDNIINQYF